MEPVLSLRHINKSFGKRQIITDLSSDVYPGEVFGLLPARRSRQDHDDQNGHGSF